MNYAVSELYERVRVSRARIRARYGSAADAAIQATVCAVCTKTPRARMQECFVGLCSCARDVVFRRGKHTCFFHSQRESSRVSPRPASERRASALMHPAVPLLILSILLSITTFFYAFRTPSTIAVAARASRPFTSSSAARYSAGGAGAGTGGCPDAIHGEIDGGRGSLRPRDRAT